MISLEKWKILTPLQKLPKNVGDLGKLIVAKGFKKLPKVQQIAQPGHTWWIHLILFQGEFPDVEPSKFTDEELGIPPDDVDI